ncbi:MAG: spermidine/putrescine ABC transporter substrate-binding protein [Oligoflexia bacterium]|nr:spermidine/putrescine ABC transporter substrate-binding protein [Oligoflexia bacterium]
MKLKKIITFLVLFLAIGFWGYLKFKLAQKQAEVEGEDKCILYLYSYSNYIPESVLKKFEDETNCFVQYDSFSGNEELLAKLQAGATGYDVIIPSDYIVNALVSSQLIMPLNKDLLTNINNISPMFLNASYDPENAYTIPYKWGTAGFIYNTKFVKEELNSWGQVFLGKYKGRISMLDEPREVIGNQLQFLGYSINSISMSELKKAKELFKERKNLVKLFSSDPKQALLLGEVWISQVYSGDAAQIIRDNSNYKYVIPKEGGVIWVDTLAVPIHSKRKELAHKFIDFILRDDVEEIIVKELLYGSPNIAMESKDLDETLKPSYIKKIDLRKYEYMKDLGVDSQKWDQIWTEVKSQ